MEEGNRSAFRLSVLLYQQGIHWIAQCVEYDIAAQDESILKVVEAFQWVFYSHLLLDDQKGRTPLSTVPKAPQQFQELFKHGIPLGVESAIPNAGPRQTTSVQEEFRVAA